MAKLHFSNLAPSAKKSTLLSVLDDKHTFSKNETMASHLAAGNTIETWSYNFSLVIITNKEKEELDYLLNDMVPDNLVVAVPEYKAKYFFIEPEFGSADYLVLRNTGQISVTFEEFKKYIGVN